MNFDDIEVESLRRRRGAKWSGCAADVLPAWVADMDFPVAEPITRELQAMLSASDLGYPPAPTSAGLPAVFARRMQQRFGWSVDPGRVEVLTDVVQGIHVAIAAFSEPGDGVVTPVPIYPPFLDAVRVERRVPVWLRYVRTARGYCADIERLRAELVPGTRILLLCNPHNPTGRVLGKAELEALAAIALERDLVVVCDEIHADLVYRGSTHVPLATLGSEIAERTITLTSASKAFNLAGLRCAVAVFGTPELQRQFNRIHRHTRGGLNSFGLAATAAAWSGQCEDWQGQVMHYLEGNRDIVAEHVARRWPGVVHCKPEATYLSWLDCNGLALTPDPRSFFLEHARVALSDGEEFGEAGRGFVRLNFATSRSILREILDRMDQAVAMGRAT